ncbi:CsgG/HfaB family protein [Dokdonella sp.]|uniref:CsgG/HfaB family protein n=1 Tax=Dokdonella sp. TaxID=2291710 RepID=UPI0037850124
MRAMNAAAITLFSALVASFAPARIVHAQESHPAKPVLAVLKFQDETGAMPFQGGIGRVVTNILASELAARDVFTVVERRKLNAILEEQNLAASGRLAPGEGAKIGQLTGAQYLVMGTITAFEPDTETRVSGGLFRRTRIEQTDHGAYLALDLRVVDTSSGEVAYARTIEGHTGDRAVTIDLAQADAGMRMIDNEADAKAVRGAVLEIIDYLECVMVRRDACASTYQMREDQRREGTRKTFRPDGSRR